MTQYVHVTHHDAAGHYRPTAWHIVRKAVDGGEYVAYCGRRFPIVGSDLVTTEPNAASCESCLRNARRAEDATSITTLTVGNENVTLP